MSAPRHVTWKTAHEATSNESRRRFGWRIGFCIAFFALLPHLSHASEWYTVAHTTDGIQILRKEVEGGLIAFRGIGVIDAPLPLVATVILETDRRREWIAGLIESKILSWSGNDKFIEYDHIGTPFFIEDRDFVSSVTMTFGLSKKEMVFHYQPSDDPSAPPTSHLRGELIDATFILSSLDNDKKTRVDAEFLCDPKGWIPKWVVNFFLKDWPKTTFRHMRKEVLKNFPVDARFSTLLTSGKIGQ